MRNVVIVLGNSGSSASEFEIGHAVMRDAIDSAAVTVDCATLAGLHLKAHLTSDAHESATGFTNAALIDYIETAQKAAGCHA